MANRDFSGFQSFGTDVLNMLATAAYRYEIKANGSMRSANVVEPALVDVALCFVASPTDFSFEFGFQVTGSEGEQ